MFLHTETSKNKLLLTKSFFKRTYVQAVLLIVVFCAMIGYLKPRKEAIGQYIERSYMHDFTAERFDQRRAIEANEWLRLFTTNCLCEKILLGNINKDGYKIACPEPYYAPDCLVYSFGSNGNFEYEMSVLNEFNCRIHTIDQDKYPSIANVEFTQAKIGKCSNCRTVKSIIRSNGHLNSTISALKIDIEGSEWDVLDDVFADNVNQIQMEIHSPTFERMRDLDRFRDRFCLVDTNINLMGRHVLELVFVNKKLMKEMVI
ncbi:methyltransferase domain-containing protein [Gongronella butleri]|nr:methyltransferase domain-containing protein [Gongronella butleri]